MKDKWDQFVKSQENKWGFTKENLEEIWYIAPFYFKNDEVRTEVQEQVKKNVGVNAVILPIHKLTMQLIKLVNEDKKKTGVRYANPALELIRWMIRAEENKAIKMIVDNYHFDSDNEY